MGFTNGGTEWTKEDMVQSRIASEAAVSDISNELYKSQLEMAFMRVKLHMYLDIAKKAKKVIETNAGPGTVQDLIKALNDAKV